jgi:endonuclease YncB( thermonuclease family)
MPDRKRLCQSDDGTHWPCGSMAFVALRNLVSSSPIACELDDNSNPKGNCKVGGSDASVLMLEGGWADLREPASASHRRAAALAKANQVGLWSNRAPSSGRAR